MQAIPVTILTGFLGSGKTTLLNNLIEKHPEKKFAIIENAFGDINIDNDLVIGADESIFELSNGCICCTLREDLLIEVKRLCEEWKYDAIIIESSGISEPVPVAQTFSFVDEESGIDLWDFSYIDTMVTVVDAGNFMKHFWSDQTLADLRMWVNDEDERPLVNLMVEQIEFANVIILNKLDLVTPQEKKYILGIIRGLQCEAKIIETEESKIDIKEIINTGVFDFEKASMSPLWIQELESGGHNEHTPETEEYGVASFVYKPEKPFHPERFAEICALEWPWVIRSKGIVWLASRNDYAWNWSQAWGSIRLDGMGRWVSSLSEAEREEHNIEYDQEYEKEFWDKQYGDRRNELVIIGVDMDGEEVRKILDWALLTDEEFHDQESWKDFTDRLPAWL